MKLSSLIDLLSAIRQTHGDCEVRIRMVRYCTDNQCNTTDDGIFDVLELGPDEIAIRGSVG